MSKNHLLACAISWAFFSTLSGWSADDHLPSKAGSTPRPTEKAESKSVGADLIIHFSNGGSGACQSTPIAKNEIEGQMGKCRVALLTASHCIDQPFDSIEIDNQITIPRHCTATRMPSEYFNNYDPTNPHIPVSGDSSTLVFDTDCDKVSHLNPVPLAPIEKDGTTRIDSAKVFLQKRKAETTGNIGGGVQISAELSGSDQGMFRFYAPTPQGFAIVGGDSGGAVLNDRGQLICPIAGSSYEAMRANNQLTRVRTDDKTPLDPFSIICDKRAIAKAHILPLREARLAQIVQREPTRLAQAPRPV